MNYAQLNFGFWNANGICGKWDELKDFIHKNSIDVMAVSETKLSSAIKLSMIGYVILRKDRNRHGGGVLIICKSRIAHYQLDTSTDSIESIGIKIKNGPSIFSVYAPPKTKILEQDFDKMFKTSSVIVMGDLNAHHTQWGCYGSNKNGKFICNYAINNPVIVVDPKTPTTRH